MDQSGPSRTIIDVHCFSEKSSGVLKITAPVEDGEQTVQVT